MFWSDVLAVFDQPREVRYNGLDRFDRPKWIVAGTAIDHLPIEIVCAIDRDERRDVAILITIY